MFIFYNSVALNGAAYKMWCWEQTGRKDEGLREEARKFVAGYCEMLRLSEAVGGLLLDTIQLTVRIANGFPPNTSVVEYDDDGERSSPDPSHQQESGTKPLWRQFYEMTQEETEAEQARDSARMRSGEMTNAEARERMAAWAQSIELNRADLNFEEKILLLARATRCPKDAPVIPWLVDNGLMVKDQTARDGYRFTRSPGPRTIEK